MQLTANVIPSLPKLETVVLRTAPLDSTFRAKCGSVLQLMLVISYFSLFLPQKVQLPLEIRLQLLESTEKRLFSTVVIFYCFISLQNLGKRLYSLLIYYGYHALQFINSFCDLLDIAIG